METAAKYKWCKGVRCYVICFSWTARCCMYFLAINYCIFISERYPDMSTQVCHYQSEIHLSVFASNSCSHRPGLRGN
ncbi:hypothetical protein CLF_101710 [Clonorchis sinensis]|uniref:Uncharacterized protein n=1 Tax=Clonorchis sinensis TaxID=79923 RepID=G7Y6D7_CLOSI|nr:hypothetical protein CLF_101710 [Clonorchis sinensis]